VTRTHLDVIVGNSIFDSPKLIDTVCRPRDDHVSKVDTDSDRETDEGCDYKTRGNETRADAAVRQ